jgi:hypothetical protein
MEYHGAIMILKIQRRNGFPTRVCDWRWGQTARLSFSFRPVRPMEPAIDAIVRYRMLFYFLSNWPYSC